MGRIAEDIRAYDLLDRRGAARLIATRRGDATDTPEDMRRALDYLWNLVRHDKLRSYRFDDNGELVERTESGTSTESILFVRTDVESVHLPLSNRGRPRRVSEHS